MNSLVEATWDLASLGVRSQSLYINECDGIEELQRLISTMDAPYQTVRIPIAHCHLLHSIQSLGYQFAEMQTHVHHQAKVPILSGPKGRIAREVEMRKATEDEIGVVRSSILKGIFQADRVALDPRFGVELAARRYEHWFSQEVLSGATVNMLFLKELPFAFSLLRREGATLRGLLGGMLVGTPAVGLGWCIPYFEIVAAVRDGATSGLLFAFSSNNPSVQRSVTALNFSVRYQEYIFVNKQAHELVG